MRTERDSGDSGLRAALDLLTDDARLLVLGPVGSGRTTLLNELSSHEQHARRVWSCRGHRVGGPSGEPALWDASIESLLAEVCRQPTTVLVDDVDLLDGPALQRLLLLVERRHELGVRVVAAHRPVTPAAELAALDQALIGPLGALHLGPLTDDDRTGRVGRARCRGPCRVASAISSGRAWHCSRRTDQRVLQAVCFGMPPVSEDAEQAVRAAATVGLIHDGTDPGAGHRRGRSGGDPGCRAVAHRRRGGCGAGRRAGGRRSPPARRRRSIDRRRGCLRAGGRRVPLDRTGVVDPAVRRGRGRRAFRGRPARSSCTGRARGRACRGGGRLRRHGRRGVGASRPARPRRRLLPRRRRAGPRRAPAGRRRPPRRRQRGAFGGLVVGRRPRLAARRRCAGVGDR